MDEGLRQALIKKMEPVVRYNGGVAAKAMPLVALEEFFEGADGEAGLLCNSSVEPDDEKILDVLSSIRDRAQVSDVRVALVNCDDGEWPFSDKIVVVTSADAEDVVAWLPEGFEPDEVWEGVADHLPIKSIPVASGHKMIWLWYD